MPVQITVHHHLTFLHQPAWMITVDYWRLLQITAGDFQYCLGKYVWLIRRSEEYWKLLNQQQRDYQTN